MAKRTSLGDGQVRLDDLAQAGTGCVLEPGVRIFGPAFVRLGRDVYLGHDTFIRAYPDGPLVVGDGCWIGPGCFVNSYGGVTLGKQVGLGPGVKILSSEHAPAEGGAVIDAPLVARSVQIDDGADVGTGAILLPGARVGACARVGAGAVVRGEVRPGTVVAGVPARLLGRDKSG